MEIVSLILVVLTVAAIVYAVINAKHHSVSKPTKTIRVCIIAFLVLQIYIFFGMYFSNIAFFEKNISALILKLFAFITFFVYALSIFRNKRVVGKRLQ